MPKVKRVLFVGSKKLGFECLKLLHAIAPDVLIGIVTIDDRDDRRSVYDSFEALASSEGIKLFTARGVRDFEDIIKHVKPELCVVVGWYWLISKELLDMVPKGFIGIHGSLLPKYRGGAPLVWSIINGDKHTGVSLFSFTEGMDEGDVWGQHSISISETDYISDVLGKAERAARSLINSCYGGILEETIAPVPQDHRNATYCALRREEDGWINWMNSAEKVFNFIRAQSEPYPGAFTSYNGKKLYIWRAHLIETTYYGAPGQVAKIDKDGVYVTCGDNKPISLDTVQLANDAIQPAQRVIRSLRARLGQSGVGA